VEGASGSSRVFSGSYELIGEKGLYDLYFVDRKMPGMNGVELFRQIKVDYIHFESHCVYIENAM
jgi:CheY-like chemotaxis protein